MSAARPLSNLPSLRRLRDEAKSRTRSGEFPMLSAAYRAIAQEYGLESWPRLKAYLATRSLDRDERAAALVRSACSGDLRTARVLLAAEPELARHDLATACTTGEAEFVRDRISRELATAATGPDGWPPLSYACMSRLLRADPARVPGIVSVARLLLAAGADPNAGYRDEEGHPQLPVYGAAGIANNAELTELLLAAGADPDEGLPDPTAGGAAGNESLYHAVEFRDLDCARLLLRARPHPVRVTYCLGRALNFDNPAMVELLLEYGAEPLPRHLIQAVWKGRPVRAVRALLDAGAPVDSTDEEGRTALQLAVRFGHRELADFLLSRGADADRVSDVDRANGAALRGESARDFRPDPELLERAAHIGDVEVVRRLLAAGADPNGPAGSPPLHNAAWRGHADVVRALLQAGARPEAEREFGSSALGAAFHGSMHCHDADAGPTMRTVDEVTHGDYPGVVRALLDVGAAAPAGDWDGYSYQDMLDRLGLAGP